MLGEKKNKFILTKKDLSRLDIVIESNLKWYKCEEDYKTLISRIPELKEGGECLTTSHVTGREFYLSAQLQRPWHEKLPDRCLFVYFIPNHTDGSMDWRELCFYKSSGYCFLQLFCFVMLSLLSTEAKIVVGQTNIQEILQAGVQVR